MQIDAYSTPGGSPLVLKVFDYQKEIEKVVVTAYAEALARAASYKNTDGCMAFVNTNGCIWSPDNADPEICFECKASSESIGAISEIDAIATASAIPVFSHLLDNSTTVQKMSCFYRNSTQFCCAQLS